MDPVERCLPTPGGFIRFHGLKDEIMCQFECLKHRIQQHYLHMVIKHGSCYLCYYDEIILSDGREWATPDALMTVLGSLAK